MDLIELASLASSLAFEFWFPRYDMFNNMLKEQSQEYSVGV